MKKKILQGLLIASLGSTSFSGAFVFAEETTTQSSQRTEEVLSSETLNPFSFSETTIESLVSEETSPSTESGNDSVSTTVDTDNHESQSPSEWIASKKVEKYLTITEELESLIYKDEELIATLTSEELRNSTFFAKEQFEHINGKSYLALYDFDDLLIGYIENEELELSETAEGLGQAYNQYVSITDLTTPIYTDFSFEEIISTHFDRKQTFFATEYFYHFNGSEYVVLNDLEGLFIGVVETNGIQKSEKLQELTTTDLGEFSKESHSSYVVVKENQLIWESLELKKSFTSEKFIKQTFKTQYRYTDASGNQYFDLYTQDEILVGYVEPKNTITAPGQQGIYYPYDRYITITATYSLWNNFDWQTETFTGPYKNQTFHATGIYYHFNGSAYLSLYNNQGKWMGYINQAGTTLAPGKQGVYHPYDKYITMRATYSLWDGFDWQTETFTGPYKNQTFHARGIYYHFNGSTYLSLYNNQGKWMGYVNQVGTTLAPGKQGVYHPHNEYVIMKSTYSLWDGFNWQRETLTGPYKNQTFHARGIYYHFNGSTYLSLYNNQGNWLGYINERGTQLAAGPQGIYQNYGKYVTISSKDYPVWRNFSWTSQATGDFSGKTYLAKGIYYHFNGSRYLSLYDQNNKWIGYINESGVIDTPVHLFVMGHGGYDPGAVGNYTNERDFTRNELLPYLVKYADQLKNNKIIFYDTTRNLYQDTKDKKGLHEAYYAGVSSITEIHLDSGPSTATGGHVIVHPNKSNYKEDLEFASIIKKYNGLWGSVVRNEGLSYRKDLLNLNISQELAISYRLTELGFISNKKDLALLRTNLDKLAKEFIEAATGEKLK